MGERRSFGQVRKLPSGRWQARFRRNGIWHTAKASDGAPRTFSTKKQGVNWLASQQEAISNGSWQPPIKAATVAAPTTLRAFSDTWLPQRRRNGQPLKPRTLELYRGLLDRVILPELGDLTLAEIDQDAIDAWWNDLPEGTRTQNAHAYSLLHSILVSAKKAKMILDVPMIDGAGRTKRRRRIVPLTLDELAQLTAAMPERYRLMVTLYAWNAIRFGELTALRKRDIDVKAGMVHIEHGVTRTKGQWHYDTPKSGEGGDVAFPPHILPEIKAHLKPLKADDLIFPGIGSTDYLFASAFHKMWAKAKAAIGRDDIRPHDLRHLGSMLAAEAGASPAELMQRLRHKTAQASQIYWHAAQGRDKARAARMSEMATSQTNVVPITTRRRKEKASTG